MGSWTLFIILGISAVSWIVGQLKERQEVRQAKERMRQRQMEMARQGTQTPVQRETRVSTQTGSPRTPQELRDLAARRQARIEEIRRRQAQTGEQPRPVRVERDDSGSGPELITEEERRRVEEMFRQREAQRSAEAEQEQRRAKAIARAREQAIAKRRQQERAVRQKQEQQARRAAHPLRQQQAEDPAPRSLVEAPLPRVPSDASIAAVVRAMVVQGRRTPESEKSRRARLAAAVAMAELFSPPMSVRDESQMPWERPMI